VNGTARGGYGANDAGKTKIAVGCPVTGPAVAWRGLDWRGTRPGIEKMDRGSSGSERSAEVWASLYYGYLNNKWRSEVIKKQNYVI
jgi:hypothetical protein